MTEQTQDTTPLVSVVIPTYNRSKELARAIKSVLNQTYQNFEILVVDDGSEEDLRVVCASFNDQRIRFLRNNTHTNANVARNRGIKEAQGEYIAMLDSDDEYLPHHLNRRIEKIKEWDCDGIFGSAYIDNGEEQTLKLSRPLRKGELMINYLLSDGFAQTSSHFYKANAAKAVLWDETLLRHQDYDFSVRFAEKYIFNSDYEPTVFIYWGKSGSVEKYNFLSCIQFIAKRTPQITRDAYKTYTLKMLELANNEKSNIKIVKYYQKEISKVADRISLADYYTAFRVNSNYKKLRVFMCYIKAITIKKLNAHFKCPRTKNARSAFLDQ